MLPAGTENMGAEGNWLLVYSIKPWGSVSQIVVDSPIPCLLRFVMAVHKVKEKYIYLAAVIHTQQIALVQNTACF